MNKILPAYSGKSNTAGLKSLLKPVISLFLCLTLLPDAQAQKPAQAQKVMKRCGTMEAIEAEMQRDPSFRARIEQGQRDYEEAIRNKQAGNTSLRPSSPASLPGPVTIPVVVHIVLPNPWIITDEAVERLIQRIDEDFAGLNADSTNGALFYNVRGHSLLRFVLAKRDPSGNFTTGIIRKSGSTEIVTGTNQPIKNSATPTGGSTGWDVTRYYNLYIGDGGDAGLLGIAPAIGPGGAAGSNNADGVCVDYRTIYDACFSYPEFTLGRTAVHEIGHNFGLYHTFQGGCGGGDFLQLTSAGCSLPSNFLATADDTNPLNNSTSGCPAGTVSNGCSPVAPRMYQNYMDYTDDACYSMYTNGQAGRMEYVLENCRPGYLTTLGAQYPANMRPFDAAVHSVVSPGGQDYDAAGCNPISYPAQSCPGVFIPRLRITNAGTSRLTSVRVTTTVNGTNPVSQVVTVDLATGKSQVVVLNPQTAVGGNNVLRYTLSEPNGEADGNSSNNELTQNFTVSPATPLPYNENFANATFPPANGSSLTNPDNDVTWERTTAAARPAPGSMTINHYDYNAVGERDLFVTPSIDVSRLDSLQITFNVAHQPYSDASTPPTNDALNLLYSGDCGTSWSNAGYAKAGALLSTVPGTTTADFVPSGPAQWRTETIMLKDFCTKGLSTLRLAFETINDFGNNIYIDSIAVRGFAASAVNARMLDITEPFNALCTSTFTPVITFGNEGTDTLRSVKIRYVLDGGTDTVTVNWSGTLARCERATLTLPTSTAAFGQHNLDVFTELPNGGADQVPANDKLSKTFTLFTTAAMPLRENFDNSRFPPGNWGVNNVNGGTTWERSTQAVGAGAGAMRMNNLGAGNTNNALDYFISPIMVNEADADSVFVEFDMAYRSGVHYPGSTVFPLDTLELFATSDCGATFTSVWKKWGAELQTINDPNYAYNTAFIPRHPREWKRMKVYLSPFVGTDNFQLYFTMKGNRQNNLWVDNINIRSLKLPQRLKDQGYLVYPNPFNASFLVHHSAVEPPVDLQAIQVFNTAGQQVWSKFYNGNATRQITVDLGGKAAGVYILKLMYTNKTLVERIIKQ
jgi:hypothetical protein